MDESVCEIASRQHVYVHMYGRVCVGAHENAQVHFFLGRKTENNSSITPIISQFK